MKIGKLRHFGIPTNDLENSVAFYSKYGLQVFEEGRDRINGNPVEWIKMIDDTGVVLELVKGWVPHVALTVDRLNEDAYIYITPSGKRVQFDFDPGGNLVEFVEE